MKTFTKAIFGLLALMLVFVVTVSNVEATTYTKSYTGTGAKISVEGFGDFYRFTHTFVAATDTVIITLPRFKPKAGNDTTKYILNVYTTSANGDSTDIGLRWRYSSDNANWKLATLGTDSTTWVSTATGTNATLNSVRIILSDHGGYQPYESLMLVGITGNNIGTKVKIDVIAQNPPQ